MSRAVTVPALLLTALVLSGCQTIGGWFSDDDAELQPAELVEFTPEVSVEEVWSTRTGKGSGKSRPDFRPLYDDGLIWVGDRAGNIVAVDAESGRIEREFETGLPLSSGPNVVDGRLLVGTFDGEILMLDAANGRELWRNRMSSEVLAQPQLHDGIVIARSIDGRVFGFDENDGRRTWVYDRSVPLLTLRGNSDPLTRAGRVYIGYDDGMVVALDAAEGTVEWEQRVSEPEGRTELERLADIDGPMVVVGGDLYVATYHGRLAGMAVESGRLLWVREIASHTGLSLRRIRLAASDASDTIWLVDRRNGATEWKDESLTRREITRPVFFRGLLVVGDFEGYLHFYDADTGELVARERASRDRPVTAPLVVGNTLYILDTEGTLSAWRTGS
ncbi:MAG: outer membrane protein assembly factor BamB [Wenzhouxiangella sp.]